MDMDSFNLEVLIISLILEEHWEWQYFDIQKDTVKVKLLSGKDNKIVKSRWNGGGSTEDAPDLQPDTYGLGVKKNAAHKWFVIDKVDNYINY